ncbi:MAG: ribosome biogenesis GTPase [Myxococcota bacterium]|jgi:ribosome biogenesis GTPase
MLRIASIRSQTLTNPVVSEPVTLDRLGLTPFLRQQFLLLDEPSLVLARVALEDREGYSCFTVHGPRRARVTGRMRHDAADRRELPAVGDWLALTAADQAVALVHTVLPRQTALIRQAAGRATAPQVLAANVDLVFIVTSANSEFSARRIARYRAAVADSGAEPVVVLNKCDLASREDIAAMRAQLPRGLRSVAVSALEGGGVSALEAELLPGQTVAVVGSSGVGKSTLANRLLGGGLLATSVIRSSDETGQHTTTRRELLPLPSGAVLIDTPGIRELALWASEAPAEAHDPFAALAKGCRFQDCDHDGTTGCAVMAAVVDGTLTQQALADHQQLERELAYQASRQGAESKRRRQGKQLTKMIRNTQKAKRR